VDIDSLCDDDKVLLVRHADVEKPDYGEWLLPTGGVEPGEGLEGALKCEMMEETGLRVMVVRKLLKHIDPYTGERLSNFSVSHQLRVLKLLRSLSMRNGSAWAR
jgi:8-oxo-dGTP diphosphatase